MISDLLQQCRDYIHSRTCRLEAVDGTVTLRILPDRFSVEVFANGGKQVLSAAIFTPQSADRISFCAEGSALISVEKYDLTYTIP